MTPVVEIHREQEVQDLEEHLRPCHYQRQGLVAIQLAHRLLLLLVVVMIARRTVIRQGTTRKDREGRHRMKGMRWLKR